MKNSLSFSDRLSFRLGNPSAPAQSWTYASCSRYLHIRLQNPVTSNKEESSAQAKSIPACRSWLYRDEPSQRYCIERQKKIQFCVYGCYARREQINAVTSKNPPASQFWLESLEPRPCPQQFSSQGGPVSLRIKWKYTNISISENTKMNVEAWPPSSSHHPIY